MAGPTQQTKPTKETYQNQNKRPQKNDKPSSWAGFKGLFFGKHFQPQQQQQQQEEEQQQQQQKQQQQKKKKKNQVMEETGKKCKKMRCSGSLCSNTRVIHRPETATPEVHKKRAAVLGSSNINNIDASSRSMKAPLHELNNAVVVSSTTNSSLLSLSSPSPSTSSVGGSFRGMPFRRFSGCYECKMVIDPVLGISRDPSLRGTICSCVECGEIFMKPENLELHQAVRHAGIPFPFNFLCFFFCSITYEAVMTVFSTSHKIILLNFFYHFLCYTLCNIKVTRKNMLKKSFCIWQMLVMNVVFISFIIWFLCLRAYNIKSNSIWTWSWGHQQEHSGNHFPVKLAKETNTNLPNRSHP